MRQIATTNKYRKDWELAKRRNLPIQELNDVIYKLANDIPLPKEKKDHALRGNYVGYRECHIRPDWLLIYRKTDNNELQILELCSNVRGFLVYIRIQKAELLKENGEVIFADYDCYWWGRTTTGQALYMDWVIQEIARQTER